MEQRTIINILLVISSLVGLGAAGLVFNADHRHWGNRFLALILFFASLWGFSIYLTLKTNNLLIGNVSFFATGLILILINLYMVAMSKLAHRRRRALALLVGAIIPFLALFDGLISQEINTSQGFIQMVKAGPLFPLFAVFAFIYLGLFVYHSIIAYRQNEGVARLQVLYIIIGFLLSALFGFIFNLILPFFGIYEFNNLGPIFVLFMSAGMAYAATKHYLYDRQVVFSELWAFLLILIGIVWLIVNLAAFNLILFLLLLSICLLFIRTIIAEANKKIQLEKDKEELQKLDQLKDEFLQMAQHELNTPIGIISGKLSMIMDENMGGFSPAQKKYLQPVFEDAKRLAQLTKALVEVSEIDQKTVRLIKEKTDLNEIIPKEVSSFRQRAEAKGLNLVCQITSHLPIIQVDKHKIAKILNTLLSNAVKFTSQGRIGIKAETDGQMIKITVADTGLGIKEEDQPYIFEKFFQANRFDEQVPQEQQGTGLSLYIAKNWVKLHGGQMWLESVRGKGSRFSFSLPITPEN